MKNLKVGQWVVVNLNGVNFNGEITSIVDDDYKINVMPCSRNQWKWPNRADEIIHKYDEIIKVISPPFVMGSCGQYSFEINEDEFAGTILSSVIAFLFICHFCIVCIFFLVTLSYFFSFLMVLPDTL